MELNFTKEEFESDVRVLTNGVGYRLGVVWHHQFLWFNWTSIMWDLSYSENIDVYDLIVNIVSRLNGYFKAKRLRGGEWTPMTYEDLVQKVSAQCDS